MIYAYLRVSSSHQDEQNQRLGVDAKAKKLGLSIDKYIIDKVSGIKEPKQRNLGKLIRRLKQGDVVIISELSRLARRVFMLFRILEKIISKKVLLYSVKENFTLDNSLQSKAMIFAFGLAAEIERELISQRTKEALTLKRKQGIILGRPRGSKTKHHKLDIFKGKISLWLKKGWSKAKISRKCKVAEKTLRRYIRKYNL